MRIQKNIQNSLKNHSKINRIMNTMFLFRFDPIWGPFGDQFCSSWHQFGSYLAPSWSQVGPSWPQVGSKLVPSWRLVGSWEQSWSHFGLLAPSMYPKGLSRDLQGTFQGPPKDLPGTLQGPPRDPPDTLPQRFPPQGTKPPIHQPCDVLKP